MYENTTGREYQTTADPRVYSAPTGMGGVVLAANTFFAVVIIVALLRNQASAVTAIVSGALYYASTTSLFLLIASGTLSDLVRTTQIERTQRELHRLQFTVYQPPASTLPTPDTPQLPATANFVSPHPDDSTRREAVAWLMQLYGKDGQPDPQKVLLTSKKEPPGRVRVQSPSKPAIEYLLTRRIIEDWQNGYALRPRYFTREAVSHAI